jgi:hypothetical protein
MWLANTNFTGASSTANYEAGTSNGVYSASGLNASDCGTGFHTQGFIDHATGTGNISASCKWTATATATVWSTALNCSDCSADTGFFAVNNFTVAATLAANDELNVTWYIWAA